MGIKIMMLGTQGAFTTKNWQPESSIKAMGMQNNAILDLDGKKLLIDVGLTQPIAMEINNIKISDVDSIFVTHPDPDHMHGVAYNVQRSYWRYGPNGHQPHRMNLYTMPKLKKTIINHLSDLPTDNLTINDFVEIIDVENGSFYIGSFKIQPIDTSNLHCVGMASYALKVTAPNGDNLLYSSDIQNLYSSNLIEYVDENTKAIYHDTQFFKGGVHANFDDILHYYPKVLHEKITIMHYADDLTPHLDKIIKSNVKIAEAGVWETIE